MMGFNLILHIPQALAYGVAKSKLYHLSGPAGDIFEVGTKRKERMNPFIRINPVKELSGSIG